MISEAGQIMSLHTALNEQFVKTIWVLYPQSSNKTPYINHQAVKGCLKNFSRINNSLIIDVLTFDLPTQTKKNFISKKPEFCARNTDTYCPQKPVAQMSSSRVIPFFMYLNVYKFIRRLR
jgi:hypothetical protein